MKHCNDFPLWWKQTVETRFRTTWKIFKGPSFQCQNFQALKSSWESSNLCEILISVIKTGSVSSDFSEKRLENRQNQKLKNKKVASLMVRKICMKNFQRLIYKLETIVYPNLCISVKTLLWYSANVAKTVSKMSFPFNFTRISKRGHFMIRESKNLKLLPDIAI